MPRMEAPQQENVVVGSNKDVQERKVRDDKKLHMNIRSKAQEGMQHYIDWFKAETRG